MNGSISLKKYCYVNKPFYYWCLLYALLTLFLRWTPRLYSHQREAQVDKSTRLLAASVTKPMPAEPAAPSCLPAKYCAGQMLFNFIVQMGTGVLRNLVPLFGSI